MNTDMETCPVICLRKTRRSHGMKIETELYLNTKTHTIWESIVLSADKGLPQREETANEDSDCYSYP